MEARWDYIRKSGLSWFADEDVRRLGDLFVARERAGWRNIGTQAVTAHGHTIGIFLFFEGDDNTERVASTCAEH